MEKFGHCRAEFVEDGMEKKSTPTYTSIGRVGTPTGVDAFWIESRSVEGGGRGAEPEDGVVSSMDCGWLAYILVTGMRTE